ncbi:MAG: FecR family protein [Solimonas sp.]
MNSNEVTTARLEQAGLWWQRLREEDVRPEEISEWLDWCQRDPANLAAFEKIEGLGGRLDALDLDTRAELMRELLDEPAASTDAAPAAPSGAAPVRGKLAPLRRLALAAALVAACAGLGLFVQSLRSDATEQSAAYATARAQQKDFALADGSQVALGAATQLDVAYSAAVRDLRLGDGEAYFEVAHNPQRPFVVQVGSLKVVAVGTAFNIRKTGARVEVVVTQGAVDVESAAAGSASPAAQARLPNDGAIRVAAGQLVVAENQALTVRPADRDAATSWRRGSLQFVDEDLSVVVANLNRYARHEVVIVDDSLSGLRYTGTILQGHEAEWLAAIEKVFPISVQQDAQGRVALHRRDGKRSIVTAS